MAMYCSPDQAGVHAKDATNLLMQSAAIIVCLEVVQRVLQN